jgi:hypothetical protein
MERGYEMCSIALVANSSQIWWELIQSASRLRDVPSKVQFDLIHSFAITWSKILSQVKNNFSFPIELPPFKGSWKIHLIIHNLMLKEAFKFNN